MSIIGTLEVLPLPQLLRRIETFSKTGLMAITQGTQSVELYFRDGQLMCVGPVRTDIMLAERLVQDRIISHHAMNKVLHMLEATSLSETRIALTLMDLGYTRREDLRTWMIQKVTEVFRVLLTWKSGSIDFVENVAEPSERLLVSLSISELLEMLSITIHTPFVSSVAVEQEVYAAMETQVMQVSQSTHHPIARQEAFLQMNIELEQERSFYQSIQDESSLVAPLPKSDITQSPTLYESSQFSARPTDSPLPFSTAALLTSLAMPDVPDTKMPSDSPFDMQMLFSGLNNVTTPESEQSHHSMSLAITPAPVESYVPARKVDTSFMQPDMVMIPVDFSQESDQHMTITPLQWQLLTRADGQTSLEQICTVCRMQSDIVCQTAGELIAEKLIYVVPPHVVQANQSSSTSPVQPSAILPPISRELVTAGLHNGLVAPGSHASVASPWGDVLTTSNITQLSPSFETQSQWGNGGNGASFVPGQGWVAPVQQLRPLQSHGPFAFGSGPYPTVQSR